MAKKKEAEAILREIRRDRKRGATALAVRALDALALSKSVLKPLLTVRESMPMIAVVVRLAKRNGIPAARREVESGVRKIIRQAKEYLPAGAKFAIFSTSGTLGAVLDALDAQIVKKEPDVALVGADALYPGGDFVNAKGTAAFVRRHRLNGAAVYVVASKLKRIRKEIPLERGFERVRGHLVHAILTETGISYPHSGTLAGVDPAWFDRGPAGGVLSRGACHPQHEG